MKVRNMPTINKTFEGFKIEMLFKYQDDKGNTLKLIQKEQIRMVGNSVPPPTARALVEHALSA